MNEPAFESALRTLHGASSDPTAASSLARRLKGGTASEAEWTSSGESLLRVDPAAAQVVLATALRYWPRSTALHYLLGNAWRLCGQAESAERSLREAIRFDPAHVNASLSLAYLLRAQGRLVALAEVVIALWRHAPRSLEGDRRTLSFLRECERFAEADTVLADILAVHGTDAMLQRLAGEIALVLGRFDAARVRFRTAIERDPTQASPWLRLAHTHRFVDAADPDLALLREGAARSDLGLDVDSAIGFGRGKALDDLGEYAEAARTFAETNARWHAAHPWDSRAWQQFVEMQCRASLPPAEESGVDTESIPVFIVGLPRSGTTLSASLLARDPSVRARGELNWIAALARQLGPTPTSAACAAAGRLYLRQLRQDDAPARFYIDKNPLNSRHLGLIAAMLPQARIIHCRRDPRDTALSLWSQHFAHDDMAWSYDFDDIAAFSRGHAQLMQHWKAALALPIFELDYETLVGEPERTLGRVRRFLGLDAAPPSAQEASAEVFATASVWQARQTIHGHSVERWRRYAPYLPGLLDARFD